MVEIAPFKAVTLNPVLNEKENFVSPVYDTIDEKTYERHAPNKRNIMHATRRRDGANLDEFIELADKTIKTLFTDHILEERYQESLYIYTVSYTISDSLKSEIRNEVSKSEHTLVGLVVLVRVDETGGEIVGHESVFDDNTEERYYLMKECRMNFSPILAEYNEDDTAINQIFVDYIEKNPSLIEIEHAGETHSLWDIEDSNLRENIIRSLKGQRLMILDGHHRYTASRRLAKDDGVKDTMMMLVGGHDPNLLLFPWHRCIKGVSRDMLSEIVKEHVEARYEDCDTFIHAFTADENINSAMYDGSDFHILKDLDIFKLQETVIDPLIESKGEISFLPTIKDAVDAVDQGRCTASFIVKPPKIGTVEEMAHRGVSLPQKSTRFLPKVIEGIIMRRF
ncbi:MAG: hypothetical protein SYNGOMJ08_00290 [Candidatus Syntrophoarchaeum sp. GoM_oil]|nr:MAG: hypothetical protein SYNGOMJ08_00290 [Candidatus Syntrophoarchaeum sp. GoM_oil]